MATEEEARAAKRRHSVLLLQQPGVSGVGVERDSEGSYFIAIYLDQTDPEAGKDVPSQLGRIVNPQLRISFGIGFPNKESVV